MIVTPGCWMILKGSVRVSIASGMPCGRQRSVGAPTPRPFLTLLVQRLRPRLERRTTGQIGRDVVDVLRSDAAVGRHDPVADHFPHTGQIRLAIGCSRSGRRQIRRSRQGAAAYSVSARLIHCACAIADCITTTAAINSRRDVHTAKAWQDHPGSSGSSDAGSRRRRSRIRDRTRCSGSRTRAARVRRLCERSSPTTTCPSSFR